MKIFYTKSFGSIRYYTADNLKQGDCQPSSDLTHFLLFLQAQIRVILTQAEIFILVAALSAEGFAGSWYTGALHRKLDEPIPVAMPLVLASVRTLVMMAGFLAGAAISPLINDNRIVFGLILIFITGLKISLETFRFNPEEKIILVDNFTTLLLWSVAGSFSVFLAGAGAGLGIAVSYSALAVFFLISVLGSYAGSGFGSGKGLRPGVRYMVLVSGVVIMIISLRLLILLLF
jgi:putative Mn2+ efflux pump MntP